MLQSVNMVDFRKKPGEILNLTYYQKNTFLVKRGNRIMAVLMPIDSYKSLSSSDDVEIYSPQRIREFEEADKLDSITRKKITKLF